MRCVKCINGHFYDANTYSICPTCESSDRIEYEDKNKKSKKIKTGSNKESNKGLWIFSKNSKKNESSSVSTETKEDLFSLEDVSPSSFDNGISNLNNSNIKPSQEINDSLASKQNSRAIASAMNQIPETQEFWGMSDFTETYNMQSEQDNSGIQSENQNSEDRNKEQIPSCDQSVNHEESIIAEERQSKNIEEKIIDIKENSDYANEKKYQSNSKQNKFEQSNFSQNNLEQNNQKGNFIDENESSLAKKLENITASSDNKTVSYFASAMKAMNQSNSGDTKKESETERYESQSSSPAEYRKTEEEPVVNKEPPTGWIVCIQGPHFGECFNLGFGKNTIGRNTENKIILSKDKSISRVQHACIIYEPKKRKFHLQPGNESGLTYLNDDLIMESKIMSPKDIIEVGNTRFMFIPLCDDTFNWEDIM